MKQVVATCIYQNNMIYTLAVQYKDRSVTLVSYESSLTDGRSKPYQYKCFNDMYKSILSILKQNGYYTKSFTAFNSVFYNINFITLNNPAHISRHGLPENY